MYGRRITSAFGEAVAVHRRILLTGPERVGKSTLVRTYVRRRGGSVLDLRDPAERDRVTADVDAVLSRLSPPVGVLEHDRIPGLWQDLAAWQDRTDPAGDPWVGTSTRRATGSASAPRGSATLPVETLTLDERAHEPAPRFAARVLSEGTTRLAGWRPAAAWDVTTLLREASLGGFPEVATSAPAAAPAALERLLTEVLLPAVEADGRLRRPAVLRDLLGLHARTAGEPTRSAARTARALAVSAPTLARYRSLLHEHHLLRALPDLHPPAAAATESALPSGAGAGSVNDAAAVCDAGLAAHLLGVTPTQPPAPTDPVARPLLLALLAHDLSVQLTADGVGARLAQHRTADGRGVLALAADDGRVIGVDVAAALPVAGPGAASEGLEDLAGAVGADWGGGILLAPVEEVTRLGRVLLAPLSTPWQLR